MRLLLVARPTVMIETKIKRKIAELINRARAITAADGIVRDEQHFGACEGWLAETRNVVQLAIPTTQNAYRLQIEKVTDSEGKAIIRCVASAAEILRGLLRDIEDGLLGDLGNKIRAETFDDFLDHAEIYLRESRKEQAGVIAGVAFEDTIRRIYRDKITDDDKGKQVDELINALARQI